MNRKTPTPWSLVLWGLIVIAPGVAGAGEPGHSFLQRPEVDGFQLRVMCWNVRGNSVFPDSGKRYDSFKRIVRAVAPDVICLQEVIGPGTRDKLLALMNESLPSPDGQSWHVHTASDNAVISRYPLLHRGEDLPVPFPLPQFGLPDFRYGQATCLVDLPDSQVERDVYIVAMHNKSYGGDENVRLREVQSDSVVRHLRRLRRAGNTWFTDRTPLLILGDMNVLAVEPADPTLHLTTLLTGNIMDEATFGPDIKIDGDGTNLVEAKPRHNGRDKEFYTWREDQSAFPPGALDRILFTDSVLTMRHGFVLNTTTMTADELKGSGLLSGDVLWDGVTGHYDHLPLVADFVPR